MKALGAMMTVCLVVPVALGSQAPGAVTAPEVPLREGLTIVTAVNDRRGDYESIKRVIQADRAGIRISYSADAPVDDGADNPLAALLGGGCRVRGEDGAARTVVRIATREDFETAGEYRMLFNVCASEERFPGSTAIGLSSRSLRELKSRGETALRVPSVGASDDLESALDSLLGALLGETPAAGERAGDTSMMEGTLKRIGGAVPIQVLVNDVPVSLPAVHARGRLGDEDAEFWILDNAANPLALRYAIGGSLVQAVKITFPLEERGDGRAPGSAAAPAAAAVDRLARELADEGRAVVYGIYFDFASDRIREESEAVLAEIAAVLRQNPTWSLAVEGHTDSIGGNAVNLDLSQRRAAAVKQALVAGHRIDASRLSTSGHGASRPKDTNDTLEGRAMNRRVELVRR